MVEETGLQTRCGYLMANGKEEQILEVGCSTIGLIIRKGSFTI